MRTTGKLSKNLGHLAVNFGHPKKNTISIEIHHGNRKNVATLRTVRSIIENLIIGVTKGFKYKMRYVYAHFPINVNLDKNKETGLYEVEIRNFIGEKIVRRVTMHEGVDVEISKSQKDELILTGNSLENVSQSAADIQQICRVRNKDIRKVRFFFFPLYGTLRANQFCACGRLAMGADGFHRSTKLGSTNQITHAYSQQRVDLLC
ncbi:hypothetical protein MKX07_001865 [Trichoderma sp. CBMAI-0711]|nr:hypothetical protein MKX07_001865 [Trichoderma sp. CBMAI-0711]